MTTFVDLTEDSYEDNPSFSTVNFPPKFDHQSTRLGFLINAKDQGLNSSRNPLLRLPEINVNIHQPAYLTPYNLENSSVNSFKRRIIDIPFDVPTIRFSLINTKEFTARTDGVVSTEVISILKMVPGVTFDWNSRRWIFPLSSHDTLQVALSSCRVSVEPLPRTVIIAAIMQNRRERELETQGAINISLDGKIHDRLLTALAEFQKEGVRFIIRNNGRAMLADEMGLGKTIQSLAVVAAFREDWPVLIVVPSSARYQWQSELLSWLSPELLAAYAVALVDSGSFTIQRTHKIVIVSYNLIPAILDQINRKAFGFVIADESHYLKNSKSLRSQVILPLIRSCKRALLLTGTPALSRPMELFTQLNAIAPSSWPNEADFADRYCRKRKGVSALEAAASNTAELHAMLKSTIMIRRLKKDILTQLPEKKRKTVRVKIFDSEVAEGLEMLLNNISTLSKLKKVAKKMRKRLREKDSQSTDVPQGDDHNDDNHNDNNDGDDDDDDEARDVNEKEDEYIDKRATVEMNAPLSAFSSYAAGTPVVKDLEWKASEEEDGSRGTGDGDGNDGNPKEKKKSLLMALFNESGLAKLPDVLRHLNAFLNNPIAGKVLVFAHHRKVLDGLSSFLQDRGQDFIRIDGLTPSKERFNRVQRFQQSSTCRVAVLAITAAGTAITLTAAASVYFAELFWTPGALLQAEDRAHRIGQTSAVTITYFLASGTIDDLLWPLIRSKMRTLGLVVEGQEDIDLNAVEQGGEADLVSNSLGEVKDVNDEESNMISGIVEEVAEEELIIEKEVKKKNKLNDDEGESSSDEDFRVPSSSKSNSRATVRSARNNDDTFWTALGVNRPAEALNETVANEVGQGDDVELEQDGVDNLAKIYMEQQHTIGDTAANNKWNREDGVTKNSLRPVIDIESSSVHSNNKSHELTYTANNNSSKVSQRLPISTMDMTAGTGYFHIQEELNSNINSYFGNYSESTNSNHNNSASEPIFIIDDDTDEDDVDDKSNQTVNNGFIRNSGSTSRWPSYNLSSPTSTSNSTSTHLTQNAILLDEIDKQGDDKFGDKLSLGAPTFPTCHDKTAAIHTSTTVEFQNGKTLVGNAQHHLNKSLEMQKNLLEKLRNTLRMNNESYIDAESNNLNTQDDSPVTQEECELSLPFTENYEDVLVEKNLILNSKDSIIDGINEDQAEIFMSEFNI